MLYWRKGCGIIREVLDVMRRYYAANRREIQESGYFFVNNRGNRYTEQSIRLMVGKYTSECGISQKITPHMFRHSFATYLIEEGLISAACRRSWGTVPSRRRGFMYTFHQGFKRKSCGPCILEIRWRLIRQRKLLMHRMPDAFLCSSITGKFI